jgi:dihydroorotase
MKSICVKNGLVINRGTARVQDILIRDGRIVRIDPVIDEPVDIELDASGKCVFPGIIDDQVHFREPGLTHKADIATESRAAVMGGVTAYMEMPNVKPPSVTQVLLEEKYAIASRTSLANYSFYMGTTNDNLDEVLRTNPADVCGVKVFMGSSTGNMLVDEPSVLERLFAEVPLLIATHCEDEATVRRYMEDYQRRFGSALTAAHHPLIRPVEACLLSSSYAVGLAKKYGTRLHVLHISTEEELALFDASLPLEQKRITTEVCVHHLLYSADDYERLGNRLKCNPAIKENRHRAALLPALLDGRLDVVATDHAPHTLAEKEAAYPEAPAGLPLVQHALNIMLQFHQQGDISLPMIAEKMSHAPAVLFRIVDRGFLDEGYWADLCIVDPEAEWTVSRDNIAYKCGWSPLEGHTFKGRVETTVVSGHLAWHNGRLDASTMGQRLRFYEAPSGR